MSDRFVATARRLGRGGSLGCGMKVLLQSDFRRRTGVYNFEYARKELTERIFRPAGTSAGHGRVFAGTTSLDSAQCR
jgi:hypothetical protein